MFPNKLTKRIFVILVLFCGPIEIIGLCIAHTAKPDVFFMSGFAVDRSENVYVGSDYQICVYQNNTCVKKISPLPRGYWFTIEQDLLYVYSGNQTSVFDLDGQQLKTENMQNDLQNPNRTFVTENGSVYKKQFHFGKYQIVKNDQVVYEMPTGDFVIKCLCIAPMIVFALLCPVFCVSMSK